MRGAPDYSGMKVDVVLRPEWAAKEGTDKTLVRTDAGVVPDELLSLDYAVPAGKTFYLVGIGVSIFPEALADRAHLAYAQLIVVTSIPSTLAYLGVLGGGDLQFSIPRVLPGGKSVYIRMVNRSDVNVSWGISAWGYEI